MKGQMRCQARTRTESKDQRSKFGARPPKPFSHFSNCMFMANNANANQRACSRHMWSIPFSWPWPHEFTWTHVAIPKPIYETARFMSGACVCGCMDVGVSVYCIRYPCVIICGNVCPYCSENTCPSRASVWFVHWIQGHQCLTFSLINCEVSGKWPDECYKVQCISNMLLKYQTRLVWNDVMPEKDQLPDFAIPSCFDR